jgi:hypothetical protein
MKNKNKKISFTITLYITLVLVLSLLFFAGVLNKPLDSMIKKIDNLFYGYSILNN